MNTNFPSNLTSQGSLLLALVKGEPISREMTESELYDMCEREHASCSDGCIVFALNGGPVNPQRPFDENRGCDCFKNGKSMFDFIKKHG